MGSTSPLHLRKWWVPVATLLAVTLGGCADQVEGHICLHLVAVVEDQNGQPKDGAEIWLVDRDFSKKAQPGRLRTPVCHTDERGECRTEVTYGYGFASWAWLERFRRQHQAGRRFEVLVRENDQLVASQILAPLTAKQIQGWEETVVRVRLPSPGS